MPQLRCAQTSELIAEGTDVEIAVLAAELGAEVVVDAPPQTMPEGIPDVPGREVIKIARDEHDRSAAKMREAAADTKSPAKMRADLAKRADDAEAEIAAAKAKAPKVRQAIEAARDRVEKRRRKEG